MKQGKYARAIEKLLAIPDTALPLTEGGSAEQSAEQETLSKLLREAAVLPSTPAAMMVVLEESAAKLKLLSREFFIESVEHAVGGGVFVGTSFLIVAFRKNAAFRNAALFVTRHFFVTQHCVKCLSHRICRCSAAYNSRLTKTSIHFFSTTIPQVRCCLLTGFQAGQRKQIDIPDDVLDDAIGDMSLEETKDDLEKRQKVKEQVQDTARKQEKEVIEIAPKMLDALEKYRAQWDAEKDGKNGAQTLDRLLREMGALQEKCKKIDARNGA